MAPIDGKLASPDHNCEEDESEWEYEYSATETETYYLTLDLSLHEFIEQQTKEVVKPTDAYRNTWFNPVYGVPEAESSKHAIGMQDDDEGDGDDEVIKPVQAELQDDDNDGDTENGSGSPRPPLQERMVESNEIQIMELHSEHPLFLYREMTFRGTWAANIGTEMVFAPHDDQRPLPALRNLTGDVDLLAACSARINFSQTLIQPKTDAGPNESLPPLEGEEFEERYRQNGGVYIHVGNDNTGERVPQARFLEDLIALKRRRGETDEVTTVGVDTKHDALVDEDQIERRRRRKNAGDAKRRKIIKEDELAGGPRRRAPVGRPRTRGLRGRSSRSGPGGSTANRNSLEGASSAQGDSASLPTPKQWGDLQHGK